MVDVGLIVLFILQHSLMAAQQLLMRYWQPVQDAPVLWNTSREPWVTWVPLICFILHFIAWLVIFSILLIFDYAELMGVKQVYYHCLGMGDPLAVKSMRAVHLFSYLCHPVYRRFLLILWAVPCLSLERLLLVLLFMAYITCAHNLDQQDYLYLQAQLDKNGPSVLGGELNQCGPNFICGCWCPSMLGPESLVPCTLPC
ncbi:Hypothetical predicted protein [Podarcis lilfordi]|uniref:Nurim n=1 Tax=Podarcis lilfordi TaxID=74358 RepID=A0AA35JYG6_9SAUR|nr:Hypothetical predicted protein [Podarcis lilfordi]